MVIRYEIESDIPAPEPDLVGRPYVYPFARMKVGDSFEVEGKACTSARSSASRYAKKHGVKFLSHKTGEAKLRIWRVE